MSIQTINPASGQKITTYPIMSKSEIDEIIQKSHEAFLKWRKSEFSERAAKMKEVAKVLLKNKETYAQLISEEMGKLPQAGHAEIEKCALCCNYFAEHAEKFLSPKKIETEMRRSYVNYNPLGVILSIMPWNFPFWQLFRFAAPNIMAGNVTILKHAAITTGCGLAIEKIFTEAGFETNILKAIIVENKDIESIIHHPKIAGVTFTGSTRAGRVVASQAGSALKKVVLELGGSDPYIILEDADLEQAAELIVGSRMHVTGQSCIAPKRILAVEPIRAQFEQLILKKLEQFVMGDPKNPKTTIGPLARQDLRDNLHKQVQESISKGAKAMMGGVVPENTGFYYPPTVLTNVKKGMPAYDEELFGPVLTFIDVKDEQEAIRIANDTPYGLGAGVFTKDLERGQKIAANELNAGSCFVNSIVKSDPRLPFGGIKASGLGRELSEEGIKEFVNIKTVVVG